MCACILVVGMSEMLAFNVPVIMSVMRCLLRLRHHRAISILIQGFGAGLTLTQNLSVLSEVLQLQHLIHNYISREAWYSIVVTAVCVSVCLSVPGRMPTLLHGPGE